MRYFTSVLAGASLLVGVGCGEEIGLSFGSLQGSYSTAGSGYTCAGSVSGSRGSGSCERMESDTWSSGQFQSSATWTFDVTLGSSSVSATVGITRVSSSVYSSGSNEFDCEIFEKTTTYTAHLSKASGRQEQGLLAPLAGQWTGSLVSEGSGSTKSTTVTSMDVRECAARAVVSQIVDTTRNVSNWEIGGDLFGGFGTVFYTWRSSDEWWNDDHYQSNAVDSPWRGGRVEENITALSSGLLVDGVEVEKR